MLKRLIAILLVLNQWNVLEATQHDDELLATLDETWKARRTEIITARIKYRLTGRSAGPGLAPVTADGVQKLLSEANLAAIPGNFNVVRERLLVPPPKSDSKAAVFLMDGKKTRQESHGDVHVFDGEQQVRTNGANRQAGIYGIAGPYARQTLRDFRRVPPPSFIEHASVVSRNGNDITLKAASSTYRVDLPTGIVNRLEQRDANGEIGYERLELGIVIHPGGILFPSVIWEAKYSLGALNWFSLVLIEDAEFNIDVPGNTFSVAVPAGTKMFDYRRDPHEPRYMAVPEDTSDVMKLVDTHSDIRSNRGSGFWWVASGVCLAGLAALIAVVLLVRRRNA